MNMVNIFKGIRCKHSYVSIGFREVAEYCEPVLFYICKKCKRRMYFMDSETEKRTVGWFKARIKLWENNMYELTMDDVSSGLLSEEAMFLEKCFEINDK